MNSPAEREPLSGWLKYMRVLVVAFLLIQLVLLYFAPILCNRWVLIIVQLLMGVIPNFIAALIGALVVYQFVKDDAKTHYVRAMRSLRSAVRDLEVKPEDVQSLMKKFVPAVSMLYFKQDQPPVRSEDASVSGQKKCFSCSASSAVQAGRCTICHDILASWRVEEFPDRPAKS